jgi:iron complex transport system ATP-binding protein
LALTPGHGLVADGTAHSAVVEVTGLSFSYQRGGHRLNNVSLVVRQGEFCCLLGPNGAGKTTLLRCLLGFLRPDRGRVVVAGRDVAALSARDLARLVAYLPQGANTAFAFTALEVATMGRTPHLAVTAAPSLSDRRAARAQLEELGVGHLAPRLFPSLSGGERQLVLLARALLQEAPVLVLDEPTTALDYGNEVQILNLIANLARGGRSILMITHQPAHALTYANQVALMRKGDIIAEGSPSLVLTSETLSDLYSTPIVVANVPLPGPDHREVSVCVPALEANRAPGQRLEGK